MERPETFASVCAVESSSFSKLSMGSWTTGSDTGSDPDD
jgi:hypothetical protein